MSWVRKELPTPFDTQAIPGLFFLDGDHVARTLQLDWTVGEKLPLLTFPSGLICELWESSDPQSGIVHIHDELDLPLHDTRDSAYEHILSLGESVGYHGKRVGDNSLSVWIPAFADHFFVTYDNEAKCLINVEIVENMAETNPPQEPLLDEASRAKLPPLYNGEGQGLNALAQVKFFSPFSRWTWYASEASLRLKDGTYVPVDSHPADDPEIDEVIFFGLVDGDELELGYFALSELEEARGPRGTLIERDRYFSPQTLQDLKTYHEIDRTG